ncbi:unnamed protein product [Porites lobata]|uniref:Uncharacterized protein n=1 Tax=Porites lobata TaxID=104759 RepID=A0ABN8QZ82_9CNID|nr:unnamed protein product [Porites lobata]
MKMLPQTAPEVQQAFESGDFVTKETASTFNQIPDDQALGHVNKSGQRAKLSEDTKEMFNVLERECTSAKDLRKARMRQDAEDVAKLEAHKTIAMKADKDLSRRVMVALESGRDVDVNTLLQSELAPVPKSLATLDGSLREAGKSDLGTIL